MKLTGGYTTYGQQLRLPRAVPEADRLEARDCGLQEFMASCPDPGAILFECTNMCPFSSFVAAESGLPVFDINTLINTFHGAANPRRYL